MRKILMVAMVAAVVAVPAALADANPQAPGAYCKAHPELIGSGKTYATFVDCVKKQTAQSDQNTTNAAKACRAEQADTSFATNHGGKTFDQYYGTNGDNGNGKGSDKGNGNAFGKCVSSKASAKTAEQQSAQTNAAKKCRTPELKALIGVGAGKQYKNFGACVAAQTKTHS
jgi:hypothetical protein